MKRQLHVTAKLADYLGGYLDQTERRDVERHLARCQKCRREYSSLAPVWRDLGQLPEELPGAGLRAQFYEELHRLEAAAAEQPAKKAERSRSLGSIFELFWPKRPALQFGVALVALLVGYLIGVRVDGGNGSSAAEIAQLRSDVLSMQRLVMMSMLKMQSASDRIQGVSWTERITRPDEEVVSALFETLNYDPNVNVRLTALDAVSRFYDQPSVKKSLLEALLRQSSPLLQLTIIEIVSQSRDAEAAGALRKLLQGQDLDKTVRERAAKTLKELEQL